jgi:hypothetical protein
MREKKDIAGYQQERCNFPSWSQKFQMPSFSVPGPYVFFFTNPDPGPTRLSVIVIKHNFFYTLLYILLKSLNLLE